jgi:hypothetical protein
MTLTGTFRNGVIVLDGEPTLAEGTRVQVEPVAGGEPDGMEQHVARLSEQLLKVAGTARGLPPDMAENHDHYLHGQPKR